LKTLCRNMEYIKDEKIFPEFKIIMSAIKRTPEDFN
jgi:hypothetical protein